MTPHDFRAQLVQAFLLLGIPLSPAGLSAWIEARRPRIEEDPDPVRWAKEYASQARG